MAETGIVFVIDDDPAMCDLIRANLDNVGLTVLTYPSAEAFEAVDVGATVGELPCCILLDLEMPGVSGMEFLEQRFAAGRMCPVIIVTAKGTVETAVKSMKLGAVDFLEKPFSPEALRGLVLETLKRCAGHRASRREKEGVRARLATLSPREREMLHAIVQGKSTKMVADLLGISARTVDHHRANLMDKMHATNVADLVRMAVEADYMSVVASGVQE